MKTKSVHNLKLIIVGLILVFSSFSLSDFNYLNNNLDKTNQKRLEELKSADYTPSIEGSGEKINITLHQSLLDTSIIKISNISDPTKNIFYEPCPKVEDFSSSYVNISIDEIYAPNKSLVIEDSINWANPSDFTNFRPCVTSFVANKDCLLNNVSVYLDNDDSPNNSTIDMVLYNATWDPINSTFIPGGSDINDYTFLARFNFSGNDEWYTVRNIQFYLNNSLTENNTWFIGLWDRNEANANGRWWYNRDGTGGDNVDESISLKWHSFYMRWEMVEDFSETVDFGLKLGLSPYISYNNKEIIVENQTGGLGWDFGITGTPSFGGFTIPGSCILDNISTILWNDDDIYSGNMRVQIYNSNWTGTRNEPLGVYATVVPIDTVLFNNFEDWYNFTNLNTFLNISDTDNNTFYVKMQDVDDDSWWYMSRDDIIGDNDDEMDAYTIGGPSGYQLITIAGQTVDFTLKIGLKPHINFPNPEDIALKVNNSAVVGFSKKFGSGYWISIEKYSSSSGELEFELSADWWDVSCKITQVQINYINGDLIANSEFTVLGSGQNVLWNISRNVGLNFFDPRLSDYRINFTIPARWNNVNVFNGVINKTDEVLIGSEDNGYKNIEVLNAGNGTYWYLTATSENLLESIGTFIDSNPVDIINYTDVVHFNATFKEEITQDNGVFNLSVYSPALINNYINFTSINSTFDSGSKFYLGAWDVSDTVTKYGEFRVQVFWNNNTAAGFIEKTLTVMAQTDLTLKTPNQGDYYPPYAIFDIIVYYEDVNLNTAIDGASIDFNIDGQGWQSTSLNNGTTGYYLISVDCSTITSDGLKTVEIQANKNYYEAQTLLYNFTIIPDYGVPITPWWMVLLIASGYAAPIIIASILIVLWIRRRKS
ncbi:MAG: hypothetical protein ACFE9N_13640 [Promethearchaeota archaeon]